MTSMVGNTIKEILLINQNILLNNNKEKHDLIVFIFEPNIECHAAIYKFEMECCTSCYIDNIVGDLKNLLHEPLKLYTWSQSEEKLERKVVYTYEEGEQESPSCRTWTLYKFATIKGYVDIIWKGVSHGHGYEEAKEYLYKPEEKHNFEAILSTFSEDQITRIS